MRVEDDTPKPGHLPETYPSRAPVNFVANAELLRPRNLIAFEGIDGAGKSALLDRVVQTLASRGRETLKLKLGRSEVTYHALERAKWRNSNPMTFSLLSWTSVFEEIAENRAALNGPGLILYDRYVPTLMVRGILEGLPQDYMRALAALTPQPSLLFLIDCDPQICCERILGRGRPVSYFESGARIVSSEFEPITESDPQVRTRRDQTTGLLGHLVRMREQLIKISEAYENTIIIENSGSPDVAFDAIMNRIDQVCAAI